MDMFITDGDSVLDWKFDFKASTNGTGDTDWLDTSETIAEADISYSGCSLGDGSTPVVTDAGNVTPAAPSITDTNTSVTVWAYSITDGATIRCKIRTSDGRVDDRTMTFNVGDR